MKTKREKILVVGGTGLIGSRFVDFLNKERFCVHILSRRKHQNSNDVKYFQWDVDQMNIDYKALEVDYIVNLAGAGIADARWSKARKAQLIESRTKSIQLLKKGLERANHQRPKVIISTSAVGYYGDRGEEILSTESHSGNSFLSEVTILWEEAAKSLQGLTDRLIINRIGIVLSTKGGALPKILMTKSIGLFNYFGSGQQYVSWIHIDDLCGIFLKGINDQSINGIYNAVSPTPLTNRAFVKKIKTALKGLILLPVPVFVLRIIMGEMADMLLLSNRTIPNRLDKKYQFLFPKLKDAVLDLVKRKV